MLSCPILGTGVIRFKGVDEMLGIFFVVIFNSKVIDAKAKFRSSSLVLPNAKSVGDGMNQYMISWDGRSILINRYN